MDTARPFMCVWVQVSKPARQKKSRGLRTEAVYPGTLGRCLTGGRLVGKVRLGYIAVSTERGQLS